MTISIAIINYNHGLYLEKTLESIFSQEYPFLQSILIDGASTDESIDVINRYKDKLEVVISEPDKGMYDALNKAFSYATGEVWGWINSTDFLLPNSLINIANTFKNNDIEWIHGMNSIAQEDDKIINQYVNKITKKNVFLWNPTRHFQQESCYWRSELVNGKVEFNLKYPSAADFDFFLKLLQKSKPFNTNFPIGAFRQHQHQRSLQKDYLQEKSEILSKAYKLPQWLILSIHRIILMVIQLLQKLKRA